MRTTMRATAWVVYKVTIHGKPGEINAVCEQGEWDAMERERPGYHRLVRANIRSEAEAEALAREGPGSVRAAARASKGGANTHRRPAACRPLYPSRPPGADNRER